ncbi:---NA--- [Paramuricea clavata]|uniref:---NA n=1 Tax=Paramuricea clavata TaxID=317549 RepID=A0A7D9D778_PARCT|nr:---NA--- [Paramuricea clavata]
MTFYGDVRKSSDEYAAYVSDAYHDDQTIVSINTVWHDEGVMFGHAGTVTVGQAPVSQTRRSSLVRSISKAVSSTRSAKIRTSDELFGNDPDLAEEASRRAPPSFQPSTVARSVSDKSDEIICGEYDYSDGEPSTDTSDEEEATMAGIAKSMFKTPSMRPDLVKEIITTDGGVIAIQDIILKIGPGCLAKDTEITLRNSDKVIAIKSLLDLRLVDTAPRVVEFLPDGLKFVKPADLAIAFQNTVSNTEFFILHGSYNSIYQKIVWELVTNGVEERNEEGVCNTKINGFCFYMFILSTRGMLARILSHLNHSFTCRAYALYRRLSTMETIDISVVLLSEFADDDKGEDIQQLKDHLDVGYVKGEKGMLKRVHTDRRLEMSLQFPGVENTPFSFIVDQPQLDSVGFVIDHFQEIAIKSPASGKVKISEVHRRDENESLWRMNIREMEEKIKVEVAEVQYSAPNPEPEVVYSNIKLTNGEITRMSRKVGLDWDSLAGLMNIPYSEREEIRVDYGNYLSISSKAEKVFELFNDSTFFDRHILVKYFKELGRHDLEKEMLPVEDQNESEEIETSPTPPVLIEEDLLHTPLSPREISRLGRRIVVEWDHLAGLMDIPRAERDDIRYSLIYNDNRSRAEKILTIFNNKEDFSREKLARCLEEIQQLDLIKPVITGEWRNL